MRTEKIPSSRLHKARNFAVVRIHGRDHYLGEYNSPESRELYRRLIAEYLSAQELPVPPRPDESPLTLVELIQRYWRHAKAYYVKNGKPTSEISIIRVTLRFVRKLSGSLPAKEFARSNSSRFMRL